MSWFAETPSRLEARMKLSTVPLDYGSLGAAAAHRQQHLITNISTVAQAGAHLWLASDEGCSVERLSWDGRRYGKAVSYDLSFYFPLPKGDKEIDIEALSIDRDRLWIAGSHSLVRPKPDPDALSQDFLKDLAIIARRPRRYLIGRLALSDGGGKILSPPDGRAPCLPFEKAGNSLTHALGTDRHLSSFMGLPDKENGLDIEGLAAKGDALFLGLRGPVIRGHAVILQIALEDAKSGLKLACIGARRAPYRKFFLDLGGLGIRDLTMEGEDLIVIAGPTMGLTGPWAVWRWKKALGARREGLVDSEALKLVSGLDFAGPERPEGITRFLHPDGRRGWLVVYDGPAKSRVKKGIYRADFFS
jgi:hypothetical protein